MSSRKASASTAIKRSRKRKWLDLLSDPALSESFAQQTLYMDGHQLSTKDKLRVYDAYVQQVLLMYDAAHMLDDILKLNMNTGFSRDWSISTLTHILLEWSKIDVIEYVTQTKALLLALRHVSSKRRRNYHSINAWLSEFGVERTSPVSRYFVRLMSVVYNTLDPEIFRIANTLVQYCCRLTLVDADWLIAESVDDYVNFEKTLCSQTYDIELLDEVRSVITRWFCDFTFDGAQGSHGYGATAGVARSKGTAQKYKDFLPTRETALLASWLDWWPSDNIWPGLSAAHTDILYMTDEEIEQNHIPTKATQHMKYNLVPKSFNKKRGVSMEPTSHMFMQKMIFGVLDDYFNSHPWMHIHLHDQERNRALCLEGSRDLSYATIDLSSASDSVTNTLVKYVFQDTILGDALQACRTEYVDILADEDNPIVGMPLEKFAPMGSAVCFPVECIVFSAIVRVAYKRLGINDKYCVYGDDIVCSTRAYSTVVDLLQRMNFLVNEDKSYGGGSDFTESCGMEAYMGFDVSPLRMSRKWDATKLRRSMISRVGRKANPDKSTILSAAYDAINACYRYGFTTCRQYLLIATLRKYPKAAFSHYENAGILTTRPCPYDADRIRYNSNLQRYEVKITSIRATTAMGPDDLRWSKLAEEYAYTTRSCLSMPEDRIECKCGSARTYIRTSWVPYRDVCLETLIPAALPAVDPQGSEQ